MGGIKPSTSDEQKYNFWRDKRLRGLASQLMGMFAIIVLSGKMVEYFVDKYVMDNS